jgi:hypothetical protein
MRYMRLVRLDPGHGNIETGNREHGNREHGNMGTRPGSESVQVCGRYVI